MKPAERGAHGAVSGRFWIHALSYQVLPLEMIGSTCSLEILINLEDLREFAIGCLPILVGYMPIQSFFLLVESRLNPYGPFAGTRRGETAAMSQVEQKLECPSSIRSLEKNGKNHRYSSVTMMTMVI